MKTLSAYAASFTATAAVALAGPTPVAPVESNAGDFCSWIQSKPGTLYKNKSNPYVQGVRIFGRAHTQFAYISGDAPSGNFSDDIFDFRRLRGGAQIDFLNYLKLKGSVNFVSDNRNVGADRDFGYQSMENLILSFNLKKAFGLGFDKASLWVGKDKIEITGEQHLSSNKIKTIERSALANKVRPDNLSGIGFKVSQGAFHGELAYYSDLDDAEFDFWKNNEGELFYAHLGYDLDSGSKVSLDYISSSGSGDNSGIDWVTSLNYDTKIGDVAVMASAVYGENASANPNRDGAFYGLIIQPSYKLCDKAELVARYQFQASDSSEGVRLNSRYVRDAADNNVGVNFNSGRGDSHHSFYLGCNYYICGNNMKVLTGVQYDTIDTPAGDVSAITTGMAFRLIF